MLKNIFVLNKLIFLSFKGVKSQVGHVIPNPPALNYNNPFVFENQPADNIFNPTEVLDKDPSNMEDIYEGYGVSIPALPETPSISGIYGNVSPRYSLLRRKYCEDFVERMIGTPEKSIEYIYLAKNYSENKHRDFLIPFEALSILDGYDNTQIDFNEALNVYRACLYIWWHRIKLLNPIEPFDYYRPVVQNLQTMVAKKEHRNIAKQNEALRILGIEKKENISLEEWEELLFAYISHIVNVLGKEDAEGDRIFMELYTLIYTQQTLESFTKESMVLTVPEDLFWDRGTKSSNTIQQY